MCQKKKTPQELTFLQWNWTIFSCALKEQSTSGHCKRFKKKDYSMFSILNIPYCYINRHILVTVYGHPMYVLLAVHSHVTSKTKITPKTELH